MTKVKKIKFSDPGYIITIFLIILWIIFSVFFLKSTYSWELMPFIEISFYLSFGIGELTIFYRGVYIGEKFLQSCKQKTVADPDGVFKITLERANPLNDEEMAQYMNIRDERHLTNVILSLLCGVVMFIMLQLGYSMEVFYTTSLILFICFLILNIIFYFQGQEVEIN